MHRTVADLQERVNKAWKQRLLPAVYTARVPARITARTLPGEPLPFEEAIRGEFVPFEPGTWWGRPWGTMWLRIEAEAPARLPGHRRELLVNLGFNDGGPGFQSEGLAWDVDGHPIKGIEPKTTHLAFPDEVEPGEIWTVYVEAAANPRVQNPQQSMRGDLLTAPDELLYQFSYADSAQLDLETWNLALDVQMLNELQVELDDGSPRRHQILQGLSEALDELGPGAPNDRAAAARAILQPLLAAPAENSAHRITGVGHAHIDSAWLWPIRETKRKCARTFSNMVGLAEEYPEFKFAGSSAQQYAWMKESYPDIYSGMKKTIEAGQFLPVGGMWVESDTNLPGSEGLVRQFTQGQRFFETEFGITCHEVWIPDSFGYTAALPQIARLAEARWLLSQKMSWNQTNTFPHSTFWWEGIDGTRVFTHFPPCDTYSASLYGWELSKSYRHYQERGKANSSLMPFGYGDGGGGPVREMVELARRTRDLEGSPRFEIDAPATFFEQAEAEYPEAPVWSGEMYLEFHRGTYTSQIAMKQGNRSMEHLLTQAEHWAAQASIECGAPYPYEEFDALWQETCLLQFHDILPGSSIGWVHREARTTFADLKQRARKIIDESLRTLAGAGTLGITVNPAPYPQRGLPAFGSGEPAAESPVEVTRDGGAIILDNALIRVRIETDGTISSAIDLATGRESVAAGAKANLLQLHPDLPNRFEAWDIDEFYLNRVEDLVEATSVELETSDPAAPTVRVTRAFHSSSVTQTMTLRSGSREVDCVTDLDWHEQEKLLKASFPTSIHTREATCEIQYGHLERPVHRNTSWDAAKFEVCAHRFVQIEDAGFGVAVINDGIYGHDISRTESGDSRGPVPTTIRLTLARGPIYPDPFTDQGEHRFIYSFVVGADVEAAVEAGWHLAMPVREIEGAAREINSLVRTGDGVSITAVKLADDRSGDLIVRCHEALGRHVEATLQFEREPASVRVVNLLEREDGTSEHLADARLDGSAVAVGLSPFQILTLRVALT